MEFKAGKGLNESYSIADATGRMIITGRFSYTKNEVDVSSLTRGVYFLKLDDSSSYKFVK